MKFELRNCSKQEMAAVMDKFKEPGYRATQLFQWVHKHGITDLTEMTNFSPDLIEKVRQECFIDNPEVERKLVSDKDKTAKMLLRLKDGEKIETVVMPGMKDDRCTVCVSSQVGCSIGCSFCATGLMGFNRNLTAGEIVSQVIVANKIQHVTNVVLMGMGEPMLNYPNVIKSIRILNDPLGLAIGQRKMVISTAGHVPGIRRLAEESMQLVLAVSLHSADNEVRNKLVPLNKRFPLEQLAEACQYFSSMTGRRVTFEYALIEGMNDTKECCEKLAKFVKPLLANVNIIPLNPVDDSIYRRSRETSLENFVCRLRDAGVETVVRQERGLDIKGACGQLKISSS